MNLRLDTHTGLTTNVKRADAFGSVDLVRRKAHQIDFEFLGIQDHLARSLRRIAVENNAASTAHLADGGNILNHADFVIDSHDGHERRIRTHRRFQDL